MYTNSYNEQKISKKSWNVTMLLCLFGPLGCWHRFYVGKIGTGIIWMFTGGGCFVGMILDFIKIWKNEFTDKEGNVIVRR